MIDVETPDDLRRALDVVGDTRGSLDDFEVVVQLREDQPPEPWSQAGATWCLALVDPFGISLRDVRRRIAARSLRPG